MDETAEQVFEILDIQRLLAFLPHRYPMLLVDRIVAARADEYGVGIKNVSFNEPQFQGHFPDRPIMPGVLLIEGMAQTAGVLCLSNMPPRENPRSVFFLTIDKAKFRKPAVPGDTLEYHVDKIAQRRNIWWYRAEAKVGSMLIAEAELGAIVTED